MPRHIVFLTSEKQHIFGTRIKITHIKNLIVLDTQISIALVNKRRLENSPMVFHLLIKFLHTKKINIVSMIFYRIGLFSKLSQKNKIFMTLSWFTSDVNNFLTSYSVFNFLLDSVHAPVFKLWTESMWIFGNLCWL